jgi:membrane-associated protease RseP (regulator of RpoE activity)
MGWVGVVACRGRPGSGYGKKAWRLDGSGGIGRRTGRMVRENDTRFWGNAAIVMGTDERVKAPPRVPEPAREPVSRGMRRPALEWSPWETVLATVLFLLTLASTLVGGALLSGADPVALDSGLVAGVRIWWPTGVDLGAALSGWSFAVAFMGILLAHEWAHRVAAVRHGIPTSPPYFIPFPPHLSVIGTLGAFIRLRGRLPHRRALLDVGMSGPLASLLLSLPVLAAGLLLSTRSQIPMREGLPYLIVFQELPIRLGEPLLVRGVSALLPLEGGDGALLLHPLAFAGWLGIMLTFLNLLPLARLDGGHMLLALDPARQRWWTRATVAIFLALGFMWMGWWVWAAVMAVLGRARPLPDGAVGGEPLPPPGRRRLGWIVLATVPLLLPPVPVGL